MSISFSSSFGGGDGGDDDNLGWLRTFLTCSVAPDPIAWEYARSRSKISDLLTSESLDLLEKLSGGISVKILP